MIFFKALSYAIKSYDRFHAHYRATHKVHVTTMIHTPAVSDDSFSWWSILSSKSECIILVSCCLIMSVVSLAFDLMKPFLAGLKVNWRCLLEET